MRDAIDVKTTQIVDADQARDGRVYKCRGCSERVQLIRNSIYGNFFKHWHGTRRKDCEYYREGSASELLQGWRAISEYRSKICLYITFQHTAYSKSWGLELYIPTSVFSPSIDNIVIKDAVPAPVRLLPNQSTNNLGIRVKVSPKQKYYIDENLSGRICNHKLVCELNPEKYHIFSCGDSVGRKLDDDAPIFHGNTYIILVHRDKAYLPMFECSLSLGKQGEWESFVYTVPESLTEKQQLSLEKQLKRTVVFPDIRMGLVTPIESKNSPFGGAIVPTDSDVILSLTGLAGQSVYIGLYIKSNISTDLVRYQVQGQLPVYINIGKFSEGIYDIFVPGESHAHLTLVVESFSISTPGMFLLQFTGVDNERFAIPLFSREIYKYLDTIKNHIKITGICIPYPVRGALSIYDSDFSLVERLEFNLYRNYREQWKTECKRDEQALIERMNLAVQQNQIFLLNIGSFGQFHWEPASLANEQTIVYLPNHLRQKIKWLDSVRTQSTFYSGSLQYLKKALRPEVWKLLSSGDQHLIESLSKGPGWDAKLTGHINALIKQINEIRMR